MSITKEAMELIAENAITARNATQINAPLHTLALPSNISLVDLQKYQPHRRRFVGTLETNSISDYVSYVHETTAESKPVGFIDADNLTATTFLNLGDVAEPGHADWRACLKLKATAGYKALLSINGRKFDQMDLVNFLEDWADFIKPVADAEGAYYGALNKAVQSIRKITITAIREGESVVDNFSASRTAIEQIEAKAKEGNVLPAGFIFAVDPYLGLPVREFQLRLQVLTSADEPKLVLRIVRLEAEQEDIARDFKTILQDALVDTAKLTIGTFTA